MLGEVRRGGVAHHHDIALAFSQLARLTYNFLALKGDDSDYLLLALFVRTRRFRLQTILLLFSRGSWLLLLLSLLRWRRV